MKWWTLAKQFPKYALVAGVIVGSTALFVGWWVFFHSGKRAAVTRPAIDISQQLALIESKPERLILVDNDLYDVDDGKLLFKKWLKDGAPLRLFYDADSKKMIAQFERGFIRYNLDGSEEARLAQKENPVFSADLKMAVFAREKEVWRADVDWKAFKFANKKKVTAIEQIYENYFAENLQFLTAKTLVVRNMNNLLRVNLESGDVHPTRFPLGNIGKRRSPDSKWVVGMAGAQQFYCYNVDTDEARAVPVGRNGAMGDFQWLGNDRCLGLAGRQAVVLYDRLTNSLAEVAALPFPCFKMGEPSPDGRFVFCAGGINGSNGALVDTMNKTAVRVSGGAGIAWVSNDTFAFSREVPDSDLRGTWLQTARQAERRISPEPFLVSKAGAQLLALPSAGLVIFATKSGLTKMKPDGTDLVELIKLVRPVKSAIGIQEWKPS